MWSCILHGIEPANRSSSRLPRSTLHFLFKRKLNQKKIIGLGLSQLILFWPSKPFLANGQRLHRCWERECAGAKGRWDAEEEEEGGGGGGGGREREREKNSMRRTRRTTWREKRKMYTCTTTKIRTTRRPVWHLRLRNRHRRRPSTPSQGLMERLHYCLAPSFCHYAAFSGLPDCTL